MSQTDQSFLRFPMGPKIRGWLGVTDNQYLGGTNDAPTSAEQAAFTDALLSHFEDAQISSDSMLVDLLEELVGMNQPLLAIKLVDGYPQHYPQDDFRAQLHLGNALMLVGELLRAEDCFRAAQKLIAEEPAPYVNLTQIYAHEGRLEDAKMWCLAGLDIDANNTSLWEHLAWIYQQTDTNRTQVSNMIQSEAQCRDSWAGASLAADLVPDDSDDARATKKFAVLQRFYNEGLRDGEFLVEFTALLGILGHYDKIPPIIWQAEKTSSSDLPWQLYLHAVQAQLGLGRDDVAGELIKKYINIKQLPDSARNALTGLAAEITSNA